jgi:short-subunit dehydrogenase
MAEDDLVRGGLAVVTGASSGIGLELARALAAEKLELLICAEDSGIDDVTRELSAEGGHVTGLQADLATFEGVEALVAAVGARTQSVEVLAVNAGVGVGDRFIDRPLEDHLRLIALNVTGSVHLVHRLLPGMVARSAGHVLITSSIAATVAGPYESTYNASKSFLQSFAQAIRVELKDTGVTVTSLMPGPTETNFFRRARIEDTKLGRAKKDDPAEVAREAVAAMKAGKAQLIAGSFKNRVQAVATRVLPDPMAASVHATLSRPGSGNP